MDIRSVWLLIVVALFLFIFHVSQALAGGNEYRWTERVGENTGSYIVIDQPSVPSAVATVTFQNDLVHHEDATFPLTYGDITVQVYFDYNYQARTEERIRVVAPEGYIAVPEEILVPEYHIGQIHIYRYMGS